ncbi:MAG: DHA2 family efflux MFS transporter permease subunit [Mobilicoccus sp.]|nr:DHA2 family efflux MFS transporter permease subunit [Mobilicoccus sp.]
MDARTVLVLRVLTVSAFIVILNETIIMNALPVLMDALQIDARAGQWLSTGYMLTMAVIIPTTGWFLQRVGRRAAYITAIASFATGTAIAALAPGFEVLLVGRVVQAVGNAIMMPLLMSSVIALTPRHSRGRVMGYVSLAISVAPAMGPTTSGLILAVASWRWLFGAVLPLAILIGVVGAVMLNPRGTTDAAAAGGRRRRVDPPSMLLSVIGFGGLVYGLSHLGDDTGPRLIGLPSAVVALLVGVVGVAIFAWRQKSLVRRSEPLLDLRVFTIPAFALSVIVLAVARMSMMGTMILLPLYFQQARGMTALEAGLMLMPGGLAMGLLAPPIGRLYDRVGTAALVVPGSIVLTLSLGAIAWSTTHGPWWLFLILHVTMCLALACIFTPVFSTGLGSLPSYLNEHGSASLSTVQQVAGAAATALVITVMSLRAEAVARTGVSEEQALGLGVEAALAVGMMLSIIAVVAAWFFTRPGLRHA